MLKAKPMMVVSLIVLTLIISKPVLAVSKWACFGAGAAEYFVPGLGYALIDQWDKAAAFGGTRWIAAGQYAAAVDSEYYQEDSDDIYDFTSADDSESEKTEIKVTLTKETWNAQYFGNLYSNLLFITWGDLYQNNCEPNTETYSLLLSPFRFDKFYNKWQFWLPVGIAMGNYLYFSENNKVEYDLRRGLTESDLRRDSFSQYYMVGVGEEMLFRGTIQHFFFEAFRDNWDFSPYASRHLSILAGSAVFAAAHSGAGFTASPGTAFLFGIYEGYVYHPSIEEFDLTTAIAIHSWWDIMVAYTILNHSSFEESHADVEIPIIKLGFMF